VHIVQENPMPFDALDARLVALLSSEPRLGVLEVSRRLGIARGTVQARLDRLLRSGTIDLAPTVDPAPLGYPITAFLSLELTQRAGRDAVLDHLGQIPEVIEVHTITGAADLLVRLVCRSNPDLQRVIDAVVADPSVQRTATTIALDTPVPRRTGPLVAAAGRPREDGTGS
jgi:DNA-binding Lrp family transcriptional regulator